MQKRKTYTREFKLEAIRLLEHGNRPAADVARELGIKRNQLYKWQEQFEARGETAFPGRGCRVNDKDAEIARLKKELEQVQEERDILKKAAQYFARESG